MHRKQHSVLTAGLGEHFLHAFALANCDSLWLSVFRCSRKLSLFPCLVIVQNCRGTQAEAEGTRSVSHGRGKDGILDSGSCLEE